MSPAGIVHDSALGVANVAAGYSTVRDKKKSHCGPVNGGWSSRNSLKPLPHKTSERTRSPNQWTGVALERRYFVADPDRVKEPAPVPNLS